MSGDYLNAGADLPDAKLSNMQKYLPHTLKQTQRRNFNETAGMAVLGYNSMLLVWVI